MNTTLKNILIFLAIITTIFIFTFTIYIIIKIIHKYNKTKNAITISWTNTYKCPEKRCPSTSPIPSVPNEINLTKWDINIAKYSAELVYRIEKAALDKTTIKYLPGITVLKEFYYNPSEPVFGSIMENNGVIWIGIRGTLTLKEFMQDLDLEQKTYLNNQVTQVKLSDKNEKALVHSGFINVYNTIRNTILDTLKKYNSSKEKPVIVTGHSLGAAVATIAGFDLVTNNYSSVVYNYASPRVGNQVFANIIDSSIKVFRVVNTSDIIPNLPAAVTANFKNDNKPYIYCHCGILKTFTDNWFSKINNHLIPIYMKGLEKM